ncbi:MAG: aminotransferase class I/II-fold pyridoxal phosphate-dependent enzyme [Oscillospiraceae bacterium]|jgi:DNA-binding transcriptional MocR family regulator|nr:aminotransferase class I/II-fold pyridoxal phosphate-dependent enzyme [Oscillospiraceae bacterium]
MYNKMNRTELEALHAILTEEYKAAKEKDLKLDMSRGKPNPRQLDFSDGMSGMPWGKEDYISSGGDVRNYGMLSGIPEARKLFADLFEVSPQNVIVGGNSSLNLMFDAVSRAYTKGIMGNTPWSKLDKVKFLCPVPGYDRHFAVTEYFGVEMINIPMNEEGPDMALVRERAESDEAVKGIWCVPKYSNPGGVTYSDRVVKEFAALSPRAADFRIFWDNAYYAHDIFAEDSLLNIITECEAAGKPDMVYEFASTAKITYAGGGVSVIIASEANIKDIEKSIFYQTISYDKVNQMRHARFLKNPENIREHMKRHASLLAPKFRAVLEGLDKNFAGLGIAGWTKPNGGYFISVDLTEGTAKETVRLCKEAGLALTGAGATFPYGRDPKDSNIRIAPTYPSPEELAAAIDLFCLCAKLAAVEKLLA